MTPEQQRIAIAEACGYKRNTTINAKDGEPFWTKHNLPQYFFFSSLPDYLNDLNAMHEAEKSLSDEQFGDYYSLLEWVLGVDRKSIRTRQLKIIHASASERAEAFLRAKNLWKD